jgi:hypothetical protein
MKYLLLCAIWLLNDYKSIWSGTQTTNKPAAKKAAGSNSSTIEVNQVAVCFIVHN